ADIEQVVLRSAPQGAPKATDFALETTSMPAAPDGGFLARTIYLSLDPYLRGVISGRHMGHEPVGIGDAVPGRAVAQVVESKSADYSPGDYVVTETGWRSYAACTVDETRKIDPSWRPLSANLGPLGMPGLTAYAGMHHLAKVGAGDTVLVSAASGAVGGAVGQIAKIKGARAIGVAGSPEKCAVVKDEYGFDACVNYKEDGWRDELAALAPDGYSVYFDNVGGDMLMSALQLMAIGGRVVLCGLISQYNDDVSPPGPNPGIYIGKRLHLMGLVVYDYYAEQDAYAAEAAGWMRDGRLKIKEDRAEGLGQAGALFEKLMTGKNVGKPVVVVGSET
ncbi:MAG: NADP-dependent oxidoreductase, partial [Pseudomonadota bacterium]